MVGWWWSSVWVREFCGSALTQPCVLVDPEAYVAWLFLSVLLWFALDARSMITLVRPSVDVAQSGLVSACVVMWTANQFAHSPPAPHEQLQTQPQALPMPTVDLNTSYIQPYAAVCSE